MISDGYLSKQIADKLHISFHTVNTHRQHMLEKNHTSTSCEMVCYAREYGII
jgi:DNA-binding NarL/FixJ family response regulator